MSIWWVNLGQRFTEQKAASALWCPSKTVRKTRLTAPQWHWSVITEIRRGEFIILSRKGWIEGLAIASQSAIPDQPKPEGFPSGDNWHDSGWLLPVAFVLFRSPRRRSELTAGLFQEKVKHSPLYNRSADGDGRGRQIYLAQLTDGDGAPLFNRIAAILDIERPGWFDNAHDVAPLYEPVAGNVMIPPTTRGILTQARIGQGQFREQLKKMWNSRCCATGLDVQELLVASHIHPWSVSNDEERLDPYNGLLLSAAYDAAFDKGLITIDEMGAWQIVAKYLTDEQLRRAGLDRLNEFSVEGLTARHHEYLLRHRKMAETMWRKKISDNHALSPRNIQSS
jgi:putative restriction endonuclease